MTIATSILVMVALTVGGTLAVAFAYAVLARGRDWWREILSLRMLPFVFMGLAVGATTFAIGLAAKRSSDVALQLSVDDIESDCDDQLNLLLHVDATAFVDAMTATNQITEAEFRSLSEYLCIDEVTVVDPSGRIAMTTAPGVRAGRTFFTDESRQRPYRNLLLGHASTVRQRFRPSTTDENRLMKYLAVALPRGGFLQIGYIWETFQREFPRFFLPLFEHRRVGEGGYCVVLGPDGRVEVGIPGHPESRGLTAAQIGLGNVRLDAPPVGVFRATLFGTHCRCLFYPDEIAGRRVFAAIPLSEGQDAALALAGGVAVVLLAAFLVFRLVLRAFRLQRAKIDALRAEEEKHRLADLALARSIQRAELRTDGTVGDGYRIAARMNAAREVGGDFYDYYELPDGRLAVTVADVSGKGVPAAFFMMKSRVVLKGCVHACADLAAAVAEANVRLARNNPAEMFVTAWVGVYDRRTGTLDYVSAGHNPPLVRHAPEAVGAVISGRPPTVEWLSAPRGAALGVFEGAKYRAARTTLATGDRLFLYTDGVTEAMNPAGELFGNDRLAETLGGAPADRAPQSGLDAPRPSALIDAVSRALGTFVAGAEQSDDVTMLEMEATPVLP